MIRALLTSLLFAVVMLASAQTTNGVASKVPKTELSKLRKSKYRVVVPTYVPAGFTKVNANFEYDKEPALSLWIVRYQNPKTKASFTLQMASDGLGDPFFDLPNGDTVDPTGSIFAKSPIMGRVEVMYYKKGKVKMAMSTWYDASKKTYPRYAMVMSDGMEASEVKRIIESLRWLK